MRSEADTARGERDKAISERDKAIGEASKTRANANDMLRAAHKAAAEAKGARELAETKAVVAQREAADARAARDAHRHKVLALEGELGTARAALAAAQEQVAGLEASAEDERAQLRDKFNLLLEERDAALCKVRADLQATSAAAAEAREGLAARAREVDALGKQLAALQSSSAAQVKALEAKAGGAEDAIRKASAAGLAAEKAQREAAAVQARADSEVAEARSKAEELEVLVLRSQEQVGTMREESWALQQRLEGTCFVYLTLLFLYLPLLYRKCMLPLSNDFTFSSVETSRVKAEAEHECGRLIKEMRALRLQVEDAEGQSERLRATVREADMGMAATAREREAGEGMLAMLRMSNAELQGRLTEAEQGAREALDALEDERTAHLETQRKLRDAVAMLDKVRGDQRETVAAHAAALEDQHAAQLHAQERAVAEGTRALEDRVRELQREAALKEEQRVCIKRHAEALEQKLATAQDEARAYLRTVEGSSEKHRELQREKEDALRSAELALQQLQRQMAEREVEYTATLKTTVADLNRTFARER